GAVCAIVVAGFGYASHAHRNMFELSELAHLDRGRPENRTSRAPMSVNTFGRVLRFTTWGESHGPALGAVVDGCPPGLALAETDIQPFLDARKPGTSKFTTQRREADLVKI